MKKIIKACSVMPKNTVLKGLSILAFILSMALSNRVEAQPNNPTNPVPLDGGISLLVAGGAALGYKQYKKIKEKNSQ